MHELLLTSAITLASSSTSEVNKLKNKKKNPDSSGSESGARERRLRERWMSGALPHAKQGQRRLPGTQ